MNLDFSNFKEIFESLLGSQGCAWYQNQDVASITHFVIEEAHEVIDAYRKRDKEGLKEEIGDLIFNATFAAYLACHKFDIPFEQVLKEVKDKVIRRHPHVFENPQDLSLEEIRSQWIKIKEKEKNGKKESLISAIPASLPLVSKAAKLIELSREQGYQEKFDKSSLAGQFLSLVSDAIDKYSNVESLLDKEVCAFEKRFSRWLEENKPEMIS